MSTTQAEAAGSSSNDVTNAFKKKMTAEEMQLSQIHQMPKYIRPETFEEKLYRKVRGNKMKGGKPMFHNKLKEKNLTTNLIFLLYYFYSFQRSHLYL